MVTTFKFSYTFIVYDISIVNVTCIFYFYILCTNLNAIFTLCTLRIKPTPCWPSVIIHKRRSEQVLEHLCWRACSTPGLVNLSLTKTRAKLVGNSGQGILIRMSATYPIEFAVGQICM